MLFEIEMPPGEEVKFVKEDTESDLMKYYKDFRKVRETVKELIKTDIELKYVMEKMNYTRGGYYAIINNKHITEYIYVNNISHRGCFINKGASPCKDYKISFTYETPPPKHLFQGINYHNLRNFGKPGTTRISENLYILRHINKYLQVGGYASFSVVGDEPTKGSLVFPYLLKSFFKQVIVCVTGYCIALEYNGKHLTESGFPSISLDKIKPFVTFATNIFKEAILIHSLLIKPDKTNFFHRLYTNTNDMRVRLGIPLTKAEQDFYIFSLQTFQKNPTNYKKYITAGINTEEGMYLYKQVLQYKVKKMVEIGMANGISTVYLLMGAKETDGQLISIDPFQIPQWKSAGLQLIKEMKLKSRHTWMEEKSHTALPRLLDKKGAESSYDMVFIDGWHTFDYTLVDAYFADKLLRVGGIMIVDDFLHKGVNASMKYVITNWPHYKRLKSPNSFAAFEKIGEDKREWDFHKTF